MERLINIDQIAYVQRSGAEGVVLYLTDSSILHLNVSMEAFIRALLTDTNGPITLTVKTTEKSEPWACQDCIHWGNIGNGNKKCALNRKEFPYKHCEQYEPSHSEKTIHETLK